MISTMETDTAGKGNSVCWGKATEGVTAKATLQVLNQDLRKERE